MRPLPKGNGSDLTTVKQVFQLVGGEALSGQQVNVLWRVPEGQRHGFQFIQVCRAFCHMGEAAAVWIVHQEPGVSALEQFAVIKGLPAEPPGLVDPQDLSALDRDLSALSEGRLNFPESLTKNVLCRGIEVEAAVWEEIQAEGVVPLDDVQTSAISQHRNCEGAFQQLRHVPETVKAQDAFLHDQLDGDVAVRLDPGTGQMQALPQTDVIVQNAIVGQGKGSGLRDPLERVVVIVLSGTALGRHAGVAHGKSGVVADVEVQLVAGNGLLIEMEIPAGVVGHTGGIRSPFLTGGSQHMEHLGFFLPGKAQLRVDQSKQAAHPHTSTSAITGSLTYRRRSFRYRTSSGA